MLLELIDVVFCDADYADLKCMVFKIPQRWLSHNNDQEILTWVEIQHSLTTHDAAIDHWKKSGLDKNLLGMILVSAPYKALPRKGLDSLEEHTSP